MSATQSAFGLLELASAGGNRTNDGWSGGVLDEAVKRRKKAGWRVQKSLDMLSGELAESFSYDSEYAVITYARSILYQFTHALPFFVYSSNTVFSPQGRLHQVEYALEAVKQGSAAVGLRSNTHVILLALKRSAGELASYQKKLIRIDDHIGVAIAGLTSDARVLSDFMRQQAMSSKMVYARPIPVNRAVNAISDKAQYNTQFYGRRPYGVGFLVGGYDETGPHLFEFSPSGVTYEYFAMAIGARSQSAKTYLEKHYEEFPECDLDTLIKHGLNALRDTLQQDKELSTLNTSIGIVGPASISAILSSSLASQNPPKPIDEMSQASIVPLVSIQPVSSPAFATDKFRIVEGDDLKVYLDKLESREGKAPAGVPDDEPMEAGAGTSTAAEGSVPNVTPQGGSEAGAGSGGMETD
ncbi:MAG: hypothetical protein CYPHOPRED_002973 [Cyphobasidiales sp. Tagirdzhanova-0007]|nr:MAG: hypothetical protein CYPHOPRED_002973 [Cyphobasidiales sp. Tagirdzhanova-0007]